MTEFQYFGPYPSDMTPDEARAEIEAGLPALKDYRNRPPVDAPRPTVVSVLRGVAFTHAAMAVAAWVGLLACGYAMCVAAGLAFR